jgi:hypothetical protein
MKSSLRAAHTHRISRYLRKLLLARSLAEAEYATAEPNFASIIIVNCGGEVPMTLPSSVSSLPAAQI